MVVYVPTHGAVIRVTVHLLAIKGIDATQMWTSVKVHLPAIMEVNNN